MIVKAKISSKTPINNTYYQVIFIDNHDSYYVMLLFNNDLETALEAVYEEVSNKIGHNNFDVILKLKIGGRIVNRSLNKLNDNLDVFFSNLNLSTLSDLELDITN